MMFETQLIIIGLILVICCGHVGCQDEGVVRLTPNVALGGIATQSTPYPDNGWPGSPFVAGHANDGIFNTSMDAISGACSHTKRDAPVWWQVELGEVYEITKVAISQRKQYARIAEDFYIDVSNNSDGSSAQQCAHEPNMIPPGETRVYTCPCEMFGRYVRLRYPVDRNEYMVLCEVQVQAGGYSGFCNEPKDIDNAVRSVPSTQYKVGTMITYTCDECYTGGGTSTCQCNDLWSPVSNCTKVKHCEDPGPIENGQKEGNPPFTCASNVKYTCNEGYWLLGAETLNCGIDGRWDYVKPLCIDKSLGCGEPPIIANAQRFGSLSEVMYQCDECSSGGGEATCRNGQWSSNARCESTLCDGIPDVSNGSRIPDTDSVTCGTKVTYTCNKGFKVLGNSELECKSGGVLNGQVPTCNISVGSDGPGGASNNGSGEEDDNDATVLGLSIMGALVVGILLTLTVGYLIMKRRGIEPCARKPEADNKKVNQDYEKPDVPRETAAETEEDANGQYAELDDPNFAGYMNSL